MIYKQNLLIGTDAYQLSHSFPEVMLQPAQHEVILHGFQEVTLEPQEVIEL